MYAFLGGGLGGVSSSAGVMADAQGGPVPSSTIVLVLRGTSNVGIPERLDQILARIHIVSP